MFENRVIQNDQEIANFFNNYFSTVVYNLNIPQYKDNSVNVEQINDPIMKIVEGFKNHPSILSIKNQKKDDYKFSFRPIEKQDIVEEILNMDCSKASRNTDIPTKIIKMNVELFTDFLFDGLNKSLQFSEFSSFMKLADVTPVFKKCNHLMKENYRPVSILSNISKVFERCINKQLSVFFENILSKYQCGFRKGFSAQHCLIPLIENWRASLDQGFAFGALLTDLSKAFDCLQHELLVAKLYANGLDFAAVKFVYSYLTGRKQRTKVSNMFSSWENICFGVPQGSILGTLLFYIYMCDLFYSTNDFSVASYADDTTPYVSDIDIHSVVTSLEDASTLLFKWFRDNQMKGNPDKSHTI